MKLGAEQSKLSLLCLGFGARVLGRGDPSRGTWQAPLWGVKSLCRRHFP